MFQHILVPLDGSLRAEQALPVAAQLARSSGGTLVLLRVVLYPVEFDSFSADADAYAASSAALVEEDELEFDLKEAKDYLTHVMASDNLEGVGIQTEVIVGTPARTILSLAHGRAIDLIVMCSHGDTGFRRWRLGSVAQKVARHSPAPVLVLNAKGVVPGTEQENTKMRVLVPLDGSLLAESALLPAAQLCSALTGPARGNLHLVVVLKRLLTKNAANEFVIQANEQLMGAARMYLSDVERRLQEGEYAKYPCNVSSSIVINADIAGALIHAAEQGTAEELEASDVIVMATHGRGVPQRWIMGSIAERVLGATKLPMLIVRSHEAEPVESIAKGASGEGKAATTPVIG